MKLKSTMFYDSEPRKHLVDQNLKASAEINPDWKEWSRRQYKPDEKDFPNKIIDLPSGEFQIKHHYGFIEAYQYYQENRLRYDRFQFMPESIDTIWNEHISICWDNTGELVAIHSFNEEGDETFVYDGCCSITLFEQICKENDLKLIKS